jgi:hypothetical protein
MDADGRLIIEIDVENDVVAYIENVNEFDFEKSEKTKITLEEFSNQLKAGETYYRAVRKYSTNPIITNTGDVTNFWTGREKFMFCDLKVFSNRRYDFINEEPELG